MRKHLWHLFWRGGDETYLTCGNAGRHALDGGDVGTPRGFRWHQMASPDAT
ncbi:hypothetical protein [Streptomyces sp. SID5910]|uniref:hypothetical protein n=1 Tax=Streptomyces sp. SID5910 TaxID=2690312 RepID=UPI001369C39F|nr:hypothetical protein [Streptomyces sp. SID5910]MYR40897.1 hypothetical protein [Streptomyces sp. SID5910]MYR45295.1 hypothetical protein [Streptomyces sp. SID5910]